MPPNTNAAVTIAQVYGELCELRGSSGARLDGIEREQKGLRRDFARGLDEIRDAFDDDHDGDDTIRQRLTMIEAKQAIVYRILGALGLLVAGGLAELVRRAVVGG